MVPALPARVKDAGQCNIVAAAKRVIEVNGSPWGRVRGWVRVACGVLRVRQMLRIRWWDWDMDKIRDAAPYLSGDDVGEFLHRYGAETAVEVVDEGEEEEDNREAKGTRWSRSSDPQGASARRGRFLHRRTRSRTGSQRAKRIRAELQPESGGRRRRRSGPAPPVRAR